MNKTRRRKQREIKVAARGIVFTMTPEQELAEYNVLKAYADSISAFSILSLPFPKA